MLFVLKIVVSAIVVASVSELSRRSTLAGALLASLPLTSILAILWLYAETKDVGRITELSTGIFWAVLPSLLFFLLLPLLLKHGVRFGLALVLSCLTMAAAYSGYVWAVRKFGISL